MALARAVFAVWRLDATLSNLPSAANDAAVRAVRVPLRPVSVAVNAAVRFVSLHTTTQVC